MLLKQSVTVTNIDNCYFLKFQIIFAPCPDEGLCCKILKKGKVTIVIFHTQFKFRGLLTF